MNETLNKEREPSLRIHEVFSRWVRWSHWLNVPLLSIMIWSGVLIYWANPAYLPFPDSVANFLHLDHRLAEGLGWHFALMWLFAINGAVYIGYLLVSGEWREILPLRRSFADALTVVAHDLRLRPDLPPQPGKLNGAQRFAYTGALALGVLVVATGIAIYKPVQASWLTELLGGYAFSRLLHFVGMISLVLFIFVHLAQVMRAGWTNLWRMVSGFEVIEDQTAAKEEGRHE